MPALNRDHAHALLDASLAVTAGTNTVGPIRVRLMTANGSQTAAGTELVSSAGYTGGASAPSVTFAAAAAGQSASSTAVTINNMPGATIVGVELWDSGAVTQKRLWYGALSSPKTTNAGDTFTIAAGSLTAALS